MNKHLKILMVSSEMAQFVKTGGLADVVGALPIHLKKLGHDVRVVIPKYTSIDLSNYKVEIAVNPMGVWMGNTQEWCTVLKVYIQEKVPVYMIEFNNFYDRWGLYHDPDMYDYTDNAKRFGFLSRSALQLCKDLNFSPDVVHCHDWQTALAPAYLKIWDFNDPNLGKTASLLTIHNAAYQGFYPKEFYTYLGLGWQNFTSDKFEAYGQINFLKGGIHYSDAVNTVSPNYANEIREPYSVFGLAPYLSNKGDSFFGILNGVDYNIWSPEKDSHIPANYSIDNLDNKKICKKEIQNKFQLEIDPDIPLIGTVGRFADQKGYQLLAQVIREAVMSMKVQFVILGTGDNRLEDYFGNLPKSFPGKIGSFIGFSNELAHLIQAGSDFFIMPSLYEPCGLNQMYSLKYGTLPIVRATGGLNDTVTNYDECTGEGTGFKFWEPTAGALYNTLGWAVSTYYDRKDHMAQLIKNAMTEDYSWDISTRKYVEAYYIAIDNKERYDSWCLE